MAAALTMAETPLATNSANGRTVGATLAAIPVNMPPKRYGMSEAKRSDALFRQTMLSVHNGERAALGVPALTWDDALAADAMRYANEMAKTGIFRHSPKSTRTIPSGESLWTGTRRFYTYDVMVGSFVAEKKDFKMAARLPDFSATGHWQDVGHYTQMIWRGTTKLGCALSEGAQFDFLVCRYFPAGNAFGKGPFDSDAVMLPAPIPASTAAVEPMPVPASGD